jgi:hypothetical protein
MPEAQLPSIYKEIWHRGAWLLREEWSAWVPCGVMWLLRPIVLCLALSLPLSSQYDPDSPDGPGVLLCGLQGFQLTVNLSQEAEAPPVLTTWGTSGEAPGLAA